MSKSSPTTPAGSAPTAVDPALLGRQEAGLRTYLTGLQGANAAQVDTVIKEIMREAAEQLELEDDPVVWLFTQGRRRIGTGGQRGDVLVGDAADGAREDEAAAGEDPAIAVHRAFGRLTNKQQEVVRLKFQFGFNLEELARITGVSQSGAGGLLHSAVERICRAAGTTLSLGDGRSGDVRLTAYALDEMAPAEKQAFVESVPDGKALLKSSTAIRKAGQQLARVLESGAPLPKRQRRRKGAAWYKSPAVLLTSLAVVVVASAAWYFLSRPAEEKAGSEGRTTASRDEPTGSARGRSAGHADSAADGPIATGSASGSGRALRPGEAAWEKKAFGKGHGLAEGERSAAGNDPAGGATPSQTGPAAGSAEASSGLHSPDTPSDPASGSDPAAENEGESAVSDRTKHPGTSDADPVDGAGLLLAASGESGSAPLAASAAGPAHPREMKPAEADMKEVTTQAPVSPKEASKIPAKHPQLVDFTPLKRELTGRPLAKPTKARVREMLKHAPPDFTPPNATDEPLSARLDVTPSPWKPDKLIVRATVKARPMRIPSRPPVNLVFAIDVSGSMAGPNRLPLVQEGIRLLAERLRPEDRVAVITYAAQAREVLPGNPLGEKALALRNCLTALEAYGQTNGYEGLQLAYDTARKNRVEAGLNAVVLCTDGNFNLGETDEKVLAALASKAAAEGITLSVFGFGRSDRNDLRLELMATEGGGRSCYVNTEEEAERLLAGQIDGLVETVAGDVALEVKFDPAHVADAVRIDGDKGEPVAELLSGRSLHALYEVSLKPGVKAGEHLAELAVNYRLAGSPVPARLQRDFDATVRDWARIDAGFRFALAWAECGRILQAGDARPGGELDRLEAWVQRYLPDDAGGYRSELLENVAAARRL